MNLRSAEERRTRGAILDLEASMNSLGSNLEQCATK